MYLCVRISICKYLRVVIFVLVCLGDFLRKSICMWVFMCACMCVTVRLRENVFFLCFCIYLCLCVSDNSITFL